MICPRCQSPNRDKANFCRNCGSLLLQHCPRCTSDLPEAAVYCDNCGLQLLEIPATPWWDEARSGAGPTPEIQLEKDLRASKAPATQPTPGISAQTPEVAAAQPKPLRPRRWRSSPAVYS
jgi:ribosomal protein L40E